MRRSSRAWIAPVVASLLVCTLLAPALAAAPVAAQDDASAGLAVTTQEFEADRVDFEITVYENGSATWTFRYIQGLETDEDRQNFEAYAEDFENNETELYTTFRNGAERLTTNGSEVTGREMSAENFQRSARTEGLDPSQSTRGVVEMSFRWDGFARVDDEGDNVVMGDVFEGGLFISSDQQLIVQAGPNLAFGDVQPDDGEFDEGTMAESDTVTWGGEKSFNPSRPRVEFVDPNAVSTDDTAPAAGGFGWLLPAAGLVLVLLLGVGAAVAYRSEAFPYVGDGSDVRSNAGDGGASAATGGGEAAAGAAAGAGGVPDEELISDEERVVTLLEENGGRMKQVNIVDETGWSKSKVSMLLSDMEDEGTISKLRVGRENIVSLAGHEPDAAGSPFEDDGR
ncbi:hypothetical protein HWV07_04600 [Natronomonas salina]|nr:hypothetical protein [Natronomonas salina]QLD88349.1 hypothetical protein HWV07_04600 [Natronomonas salina]